MPLCAGKEAEAGIARTVGEESSLHLDLVVIHHISSHDRAYGPWRILVYVRDPVAEEKRDVLLIQNSLKLLLILIIILRTRISLACRAELVHEIAERREVSDVEPASKTHTYLRRIVATENHPVLDEGHLHAVSCRSDRRTHSRDTATGHHKVEFTFVLRESIHHLKVVPEIEDRFEGFVRSNVRHREQYRVKTALEALEIVYRKLVHTFLQIASATVLPMPFARARTEVDALVHTVYLYAEHTRCRSVTPS